MTTTQALTDALERHYIKPGSALPGGVFLREVGINGTSGRRCDALYAGFTAASGRLLVGHEVKVSRADWLHELDQPHKADRWADQCHSWWLVTPDPSIVRDGELPDGWGHMVLPRTGRRLRVIARARVHADRQPQWWAVRSMMARTDTLTARRITEGLISAREDAHASAERHYRQLERMREDPELRRKADAYDHLLSEMGLRSEHGQLTLDGRWVAPAELQTALDIARAAGGMRGLLSYAERLAGRAEDLRGVVGEIRALLPEGTP